MFRSSFSFAILICVLIFCNCKAESFDFSENQLQVISNGDKQSAEIADYFFYHLNKRNLNKDKYHVVRTDEDRSSVKGNRVYFEIVPDLKNDYQIVNQNGSLSFFGKDKAVLKWLSYMLIDKLSKYHKLEVSDLNPCYISFNNSQVDLAFSYRDPHLLPNMDQDLSGMLFTHNVDKDWGLWGHNFAKVFVGKPNPNSLAFVNGQRDADQFCFSSIETFNAVRSYIMDQYGYQKRSPLWFMINPNDNDKACTCATCSKQGNTAHNATPAVTGLLNKLGEEFPKDHFFTTAYRTTKEAPLQPLLANTGVLISTINLSKAPILKDQDASVRDFTSMINKWKDKTPEIYLWDYISNFDDYLTPFPVLLRVQKQLTYFKQLGAKGVFMNGSGYDYSPFDDVKTYVLSALMIDPSLSVPDLIRIYYNRFYPVTGSILSSYLIDLENNMYAKNMNIDIYSSFQKEMNSYLEPKRFELFYADLKAMQLKLKGEERAKIDKLIAALSYVQLQINYHQGNVENGFLIHSNGKSRVSTKNDALLSSLQEATNLQVLKYKEEAGDLKTYLAEWNDLKDKTTEINKIIDVKAKGIKSNEYYKESALLCNNINGFPSDFNQGWFIVGEDVLLSCNLDDVVSQPTHLQMTFLINKRHRMLAPDKIELVVDGDIIAHFNKSDFTTDKNVVVLKKQVDIRNNKKLDILIYKNKELKNSVIACDEIQLY